MAASEAFGSTYWQAYYAKPVLAGDQPDPLGGLNAMRFSAASTIAGPTNSWGGILLKRVIPLVPATRVTVSIWARSSQPHQVQFGVNDRDIQSFAIDTTWQRLQISGFYESGTGNSSLDNRMLQFFETDPSNPNTTIWIFGAQLVVGPVALEYVKTAL